MHMPFAQNKPFFLQIQSGAVFTLKLIQRQWGSRMKQNDTFSRNFDWTAKAVINLDSFARNFDEKVSRIVSSLIFGTNTRIQQLCDFLFIRLINWWLGTNIWIGGRNGDLVGLPNLPVVTTAFVFSVVECKSNGHFILLSNQKKSK